MEQLDYTGFRIKNLWYDEPIPGNVWGYVGFEDGSQLILPSEFLTLPNPSQQEMIDLLNGARRGEFGDYIEGHIEGEVYSLGSDLVVKVTDYPLTLKGKSPYERLVHTSRLRQYILPELPEWADIVGNFLCFVDVDETRYTIMPKIGEGITLATLQDYYLSRENRNTARVNGIIRDTYHGFGYDEYTLVYYQYQKLGKLIREAAEIWMPGEVSLTDYKYANVIVEPSPRSAGYLFKLSIIDQ